MPAPDRFLPSPAFRSPAFYERAEWYDRACPWDPSAEIEFLRRVTADHGLVRPRRVLEPFCGTGRLLGAWPEPYGFDLCMPMLRRARGAVFRADAARFVLKSEVFHFAFCLNDSFRHLLTEARARAHLRAVARALEPGAVYALGFDVTPAEFADISCQVTMFQANGQAWRCRVGSLGDADPATRTETIHVRIDPVAADERAKNGDTAETGPGAASHADHAVVDDLFPMRTYTSRDVEDLIDAEGSFELAAVYHGYDPSETSIEISEVERSAILILRKEQR